MQLTVALSDPLELAFVKCPNSSRAWLLIEESRILIRGFSFDCSTILRTTQPAHIIAVAAVILVASLIYPSHSAKDSRNSTCSILLYFSALSMHIGSQFWMTFMSGKSHNFDFIRYASVAMSPLILRGSKQRIKPPSVLLSF